LEGEDSCALKTDILFTFLRNLADNMLKGCLPDQ
jgi:hypothetical protein